MRAKFAILVLTGLWCVGASAFAAEPFALVMSVQGKVLLNQGNGFQALDKMATLDIGDQVLVSKDAAVSLNYASAGCASTFKDPALLTVSSTAPCANQPGAKTSGSGGGGGTGGTAVSGAAQRTNAPITLPSLGGGTTIASPKVTPTSASLP